VFSFRPRSRAGLLRPPIQCGAFYGSDKRKIETDLDFHFVYSSSLQGWGSFHSVFRCHSQPQKKWECVGPSPYASAADVRLKRHIENL